VGRVAGHGVQALGAQGVLAVEVDDGEVGIGADGDNALSRVEAEDPGRPGGGHLHDPLQGDAALNVPLGDQQRQQRLHAREARGRLPDVAQLLLLEPVVMVGADGVDLARLQRLPQRLPVLGRPHRGLTLARVPTVESTPRVR